jgi:hypothetical protein
VVEARTITDPLTGRRKTIEGISEEMKPWWDAAKDTTLPCVALAPRDGGDIAVAVLPETIEAFYKLLGE